MLNLCNKAVDWDATGSMVAGLGAWAGVAAVVYAANQGANVFKSWKRQKVEERRMDLAEQVLNHAYELHDAFLGLRVPFRTILETAKATQELEANQEITDGTQPDLRRLLIEGRICINRHGAMQAHISGLRSLMPRVKAIFGGQTEQAAHHILNMYSQYLWCANNLYSSVEFGGAGAEAEYMKTLKITLDPSGEDRQATDMGNQIAILDRELLPIVRSEE